MEFDIVSKIDGITHRYYSKDMNNFQKGLQIVNRPTGEKYYHLATKEKQFKRTTGYHFPVIKLAHVSL